MKIRRKIFALVDCNNFFVSCERVWDPKLRNVPVIVWSNNDGCAISRSQEAKALGITMGMPAFQAKDIIIKNNVKAFSSNFTLYADISRRVFEVLSQLCMDIEPYSIDESFLDLTNLKIDDLEKYGRFIKTSVMKYIGIPVSVGIGPTKTLAKVANHIAKRNPDYKGVCDLVSLDVEGVDKLLKGFPVEEVWGVGRKYSKWLNNQGIKDTFQLKQCDPKWIRKKMTVAGERTVFELNGIPCFQMNYLSEPNKSIACTRQFGSYVELLKHLEEAVTLYTTRACEKLRSQNSIASNIFIFIRTNYHSESSIQYSKSVTFNLAKPTSYTPEILRYALKGLRDLYKPGFKYHKAGIVLTGIIPEDAYPQDIFEDQEFTNQTLKKKNAIQAIDLVNKRWGKGTIFIARQGVNHIWKVKESNKSPRYTTNWLELPKVSV